MSSRRSTTDPAVLLKLQGIQLFIGSSIAYLFGVQRAQVSQPVSQLNALPSLVVSVDVVGYGHPSLPFFFHFGLNQK